jgi:anaerobic ribonucleoside-triphosphate reductase activating protein
MKIRVNSIRYKGSVTDGPGVRTVVFLQGCELHCEGCHNQSTWDANCGDLVKIDDLVDELKTKVKNKKVTISGGEPFFQKEATIHLIKKLKGFDLCLYTGSDFDEVPKDILPYLKYIKVGKFKIKLRITSKPFIGSTNQKFYKLEEGEIIERLA